MFVGFSVRGEIILDKEPFVRCIMGTYSRGESRRWDVGGDGKGYECPQGLRVVLQAPLK
jgi:hypothetical protein